MYELAWCWMRSRVSLPRQARIPVTTNILNLSGMFVESVPRSRSTSLNNTSNIYKYNKKELHSNVRETQPPHLGRWLSSLEERFWQATEDPKGAQSRGLMWSTRICVCLCRRVEDFGGSTALLVFRSKLCVCVRERV